MICWTDLETLGSEPPTNDIIEIGAVMTTDDLDRVGEPFGALVEIPSRARLANVNPVVLEMHAKNGLWRDLAAGPTVSLMTADLAFRDWIRGAGVAGGVRLAGSGVSHFDSNLICDQLPLSWAEFTGYNDHVKPTLDIGIVRRFLTTFGLEELIPEAARTEVPHRALDDVLRFIDEARAYRDLLRTLTTSMPTPAAPRSPEPRLPDPGRDPNPRRRWIL